MTIYKKKIFVGNIKGSREYLIVYSNCDSFKRPRKTYIEIERFRLVESFNWLWKAALVASELFVFCYLLGIRS